MSFDQNFGSLTHDTKSRKWLTFQPGSNEFAAEYKLKQGEQINSPKFISTYSNEGKGRASRNLHSWSRQYKLRDGDKIRPVLLNSWEGAYFDFNEESRSN